MAALRTLLQAPNWVALTVTGVNPDHGEADGSTVRLFAAALAAALAGSPGSGAAKAGVRGRTSACTGCVLRVLPVMSVACCNCDLHEPMA